MEYENRRVIDNNAPVFNNNPKFTNNVLNQESKLTNHKNTASGLRKLPHLPMMSTYRFSTANSDSRPRLNDGRISADSAYYETQSMDDGDERSISRASGRRTPGTGRISPASGKKWFIIVEAIREKRRRAAQENQRKIQELELLKVNLEQVQAKERTLVAEIEPLKEKLKRYKGIIEDLEDKVQAQGEESLKNDKSYNSQILKLEQQNQEYLEKEDLRKFEYETKMREECRRLTIEITSLKKQVHVLNESTAGSNSLSKSSNENDPQSKQLVHMRTELMNVRQILETSERDRLNERKEKLCTIQNMIRLTKQKSDLEEELDEMKKEDKEEISIKYTRLFQKFEANSEKLKKLHVEGAEERSELQKKYLDEIRRLNLEHERDLQDIKADRKSIQESLDMLKLKRQRDAENLLQDIEKIKDVPEIIDTLSGDGFYHPGTSGKDLLQKLFLQYKRVHHELQTSQQIMISVDKPDVRPIVETLKDEKRKLKRKLEDTKEALEKKESELRVTEAALQRQIDELLAEKKAVSVQALQAVEEVESIKDEAEDLKKELQRSREAFSKKMAELTMLRENLMSVTTEMKTVDADLGKTKRDLAIKDAEILRLKQDLLHTQEQFTTENSSTAKLVDELEERRKVARESEQLLTSSEDKLSHLEEMLQATKLQAERVSKERDQLQHQILIMKGDTTGKEKQIVQLENVIDSLKSQNNMLEASIKERIEQVSASALEVDHLKTELLATQHLLTEEEDKTSDQAQDIDQLSGELENRNHYSTELELKNKELERELRHLKNKLNDMEFEYQDKESSLQEHSSSKELIRKELLILQTKCKELDREKQKLKESLENMKLRLEEEENLNKEVKNKYLELKKEMQGKYRKVNQLSSENEKLLGDYDFLHEEHNNLQSGIGSNKSHAIQMLNECKRLKHQVETLTEKNNDLSNELSSMGDILEENKQRSRSDIRKLQHQSLKLKDIINKASLSTDDIEEPLLEVALVDEVETALPLDRFEEAVLPLDDFVILDDLQPYNECKKADKTCKSPAKIEEGLVEDINWLMSQSEPTFNKENSPEQNEPLHDIEVDRNKLWNETLVKDNHIQVLSSQLALKETEKKCLEEQIRVMEERTIKKYPREKNGEELKQIKAELQASVDDKNEAISCLKSLILDNEELTNCLQNQQQNINMQRKENKELVRKLKESLDRCHEQEDILLKAKGKLRDVMETSLSRESNISIEQKSRIEQLKAELQLLRDEKQQIQLQLDEKTYEATKMHDDLNSLRGAIEYNLGSMDAEKRSKDFVEDQLLMVLQDRGHALQKLQSTQLMNKMLQAKLINLQKWHNDLEINLLKSRDFDPLPLDMIKTNQKTHGDFLEKQINIIKDNLLEYDDKLKINNKNVLNSLETSKEAS